MKTKKYRFLSNIFLFIFLVTITFNFTQRSMGKTEHSHHDHKSIVYIHKHSHSHGTHSHTHNTNTISLLDYFCAPAFDSSIYCLKKTKSSYVELLVYSNEIKNKLLKPPTLS